jgi:hypothetical protein
MKSDLSGATLAVDVESTGSYAVVSVTRAAKTPVPSFGFLFARVFAR